MVGDSLRTDQPKQWGEFHHGGAETLGGEKFLTHSRSCSHPRVNVHKRIIHLRLITRASEDRANSLISICNHFKAISDHPFNDGRMKNVLVHMRVRHIPHIFTLDDEN